MPGPGMTNGVDDKNATLSLLTCRKGEAASADEAVASPASCFENGELHPLVEAMRAEAQVVTPVLLAGPPSATALASNPDTPPATSLPQEIRAKLPQLRNGTLYTFEKSFKDQGWRVPRFSVVFHVNESWEKVRDTFSDYHNWGDFMPLFQASKKDRKGTKLFQSFKVTLPGGGQFGHPALQGVVGLDNNDIAGGGWQSVFRADAKHKVSNPDKGFTAIRKQRGSITVYPDPDNPKASIVYYEILTDPEISDGLINSNLDTVRKQSRSSIIDFATHVASRADNANWKKRTDAPTVHYTARDLGVRDRMR